MLTLCVQLLREFWGSDLTLVWQAHLTTELPLQPREGTL